MKCDPAKIVRHSAKIEIEAYKNASTRDIIETILFADAQSGEFIDPVAVECLRGKTPEQTLINVWRFAKQNVRYQADRPGFERIKSPGALLSVGIGDCKSLSVLEGALLRALGIPYAYRFAAYDVGDFTHVYVLAWVNGKYIPLDAVHTKPLEEVKYMKKKDYSPRAVRPAIAGFHEEPGVKGFTLSLPLALLIAAAGYLLLTRKK